MTVNKTGIVNKQYRLALFTSLLLRRLATNDGEKSELVVSIIGDRKSNVYFGWLSRCERVKDAD